MDVIHSVSTSFVTCFENKVNTQLSFTQKILLSLLTLYCLV